MRVTTTDVHYKLREVENKTLLSRHYTGVGVGANFRASVKLLQIFNQK